MRSLGVVHEDETEGGGGYVQGEVGAGGVVSAGYREGVEARMLAWIAWVYKRFEGEWGILSQVDVGVLVVVHAESYGDSIGLENRGHGVAGVVDARVSSRESTEAGNAAIDTLF